MILTLTNVPSEEHIKLRFLEPTNNGPFYVSLMAVGEGCENTKLEQRYKLILTV